MGVNFPSFTLKGGIWIGGILCSCQEQHRLPKDSAFQFAESKRYECGYLMYGYRVTAKHYQQGVRLRYPILKVNKLGNIYT